MSSKMGWLNNSHCYQNRRESFLHRAKQANLEHIEIFHSELGLYEERLAIDFVFKNPKAPNLLVHICGVHGPEGQIGSLIQEEILNSFGSHGEKFGHCFVHALNPFGMSWSRRYNNENVDLNRNGLNFANAKPPKTNYKLVAQELAPKEFSSRLKDIASLMMKITTHGWRPVSEAIASGQYEDPRGLFYGGDATSWELNSLAKGLLELAPTPERVLILDVHSGLGRFGQETLILDQSRDSQNLRHLDRIFSARVVRAGAVGYSIHGSLGSFFERIYPASEVIHLTQEFGVHDPISTLVALMQESHLWHEGARDSSERIRLMQKTFFPQDLDWRNRCLRLGVDRYFQWLGAYT